MNLRIILKSQLSESNKNIRLQIYEGEKHLSFANLHLTRAKKVTDA